MRVLIQLRPEMTAYLGGERTVAHESTRALSKLGVDVTICDQLEAPLNGCDVVHLFGITQPTVTLIQARFAKSRRIPIVLTTSYCDFDEYNRRGRYGLAKLAHRALPSRDIVEWMAQLARLRRATSHRAHFARLLATRHSEQIAELLALADVFVVGSVGEATALRTTFHVNGPCVSVRPGVSEVFTTGSADAFAQRYGLRDFVVVVGFLTSLKNQLRLIEALEGTELPLVIVGQEVWTHRLYARAIRRVAARTRNVRVLGPVTPVELSSLYAAARVVVLPSWFETCGLTCLEGASAGCRVVVTDRGYTRDHFCGDAFYCNPASPESIRQAVLAAYDSAPSVALQTRIRDEYRWELAAERLREAYQRARCST